MTCAWCGNPIPVGKRRDAETCSKACRQARWRFDVVGMAGPAREAPRTFGYADPPYPGCARYYPEGQEVDHRRLIDGLAREYPDGWALSTSGEACRAVWAMCPEGTRLCPWVRPARPVRSARPVSSWEALLVWGGRPLDTDGPQMVEDSLVCHSRFRMFPGALIGMKPPQFAAWLFALLGARVGDVLVDLFPGSGAVMRAWHLHVGTAEPSPVDVRRIGAEALARCMGEPSQRPVAEDLSDASLAAAGGSPSAESDASPRAGDDASAGSGRHVAHAHATSAGAA